MNRLARGSSLLIATAIIAACAAQRDEGKAVVDRQGPEVQQPATEEYDAHVDKIEERERGDISTVANEVNRAIAPPLSASPACASAASTEKPAQTAR